MYIVTGYVFLQTFHFVTLKQNTTDIEHILISSLVVGYVYHIIANTIPFTTTKEIDNILIIISAIITAYVMASFLKTNYFTWFLDIFKIRDTGNLYLWDDLMDNKYPMRLMISYEEKIYEGMLHNYESYSNSPHVALAAYTIKNENGELETNYSNDMTKTIILDTSTAQNITIIYYKNSHMCIDLNNLCDFNRESRLYNFYK